MKGSQLIPTRKAIQRAVRFRLESDEFKQQFKEVEAGIFKQYALFFISSALITLGDKFDFSKDKMLEFQKELSNSCTSYVKEHDDGNIITTKELLDW